MTVVPSELVFHHKPSSASSVSVASSQPVAITNYTGERLRYSRVKRNTVFNLLFV